MPYLTTQRFAPPIPRGRRAGRGTQGRRLRGISLGAISVQDAVRQAVATESPINPRDANGWLSPTNPSWSSGSNSLQSAIIYLDPVCSGQAAPNVSLVKYGASFALSVAGKVDPEPISRAILMGVSAIVGAIFSHHAAAVQRDIAAECEAVPAANNALQVIIQGVQQGAIPPQQGITELNSLPGAFLQMVGPAKNNSPYCNALCEKLVTLRAIVFYWVSQFQDMVAQQQATASGQPPSASATGNPVAAATNAVSSAAASIGIPGWILWAIGGFAVYKLASSH